MEMDNNKKKNLPMKDAFKILTFIFAAVLISSCSNKFIFPTSEVLPGADAEVEVNKNDNDNYEIELEVENMADPGRLTPARTNYIVWMETENRGTVNLGNLGLNRNNSASLTTTTPYKPIRIFITAEDGQNVQRPSTQVVLSTDINVK